MNQIYPSKKDQYTAYTDFYKHYSNLMFRARISIFSLIFISFGYLFKIIPNLGDNKFNLFNISLDQSSIIAHMTSWLIAVLFVLEIAYYRRFTGIIICLNKIEEDSNLRKLKDDKSSFFGQYKRRHHEYSFFYLFASLLFTIYFFSSIDFNINTWTLLIGILPLIFLIIIFYFLLIKMFRRFENNLK